MLRAQMLCSLLLLVVSPAAAISLRETSGKEMGNMTMAAGTGNPAMPLVLYYTQADDPLEKSTRRKLFKTIFGDDVAIYPLRKPKEKCKKSAEDCVTLAELTSALYSGTLVISTHAGADGAKKEAHTATVRATDNHKNAAEFWDYIKDVWSNPIKPQRVVLVACNSGSLGEKHGTSYASKLAAKIALETQMPISVYGARGFVTRIANVNFAINTDYGDGNYKNCGGAGAVASNPASFEKIIQTQQAFSGYQATVEGVTGPFLDTSETWGEKLKGKKSKLPHNKDTDCDNLGKKVSNEPKDKWEKLHPEKTMHHPASFFTDKFTK